MFKKHLYTLLLATLCLPLSAQVKFPSFDSFVQILPDDTAEVIETSVLFAEQPQESFSFYRDLPAVKNQTIQLLEMTVDGQKEEPHLRNINHVQRVFFLNERPLSAGNHTFQLYYKIDHPVTFLKRYDRFDWPVLTNTLPLPVAFTRARVELPEGASALKEQTRSFVTAPNGQIRPAQQEDLSFWSRSPLAPQARFSISVAFPKGVVHQPTPSFLRGPDRKNSLLWLLFFLLCCYYLGAWSSVGKDPRAHVVRRHQPPTNISAVKAQYIRSMGKEVSLATALLSLAIKGAVDIEVNNTGKWGHQVIVRPKLRYKIMEPLPNEEDAVYYGLFAAVGTRWIVDPNDFNTRKRIRDTYTILHDCLQGDCAHTFFNRNESYNAPSLLFIFVGAFLLAASQPFLFIPYLLVGILLYFVSFWACHYHWEKIFFLVGFWLLAEVLGMFPLQIFSFNAGSIAFLVGCILGGCFKEWIRAYTVSGRIVMDKLEGFKEYLLVGEKNRLARTNPTNSLEFFCRHLPYACALGIPTKWTQRFENYLGLTSSKTLENNGLFFPGINDTLGGLDTFFSSIAASGGGQRFSRD